MVNIAVEQILPLEQPDLYSQVLNLRNEVLRLPIGLDLFQEDLSQEVNHFTFAVISNAKSDDIKAIEIDSQKDQRVVGCILLAPLEGDEKTLKVRQMAISPEFQGQGLGAKLVKTAEEFTKRQGKSRLYLHARAHAIGFYMKSGFQKVNDIEFLELGIPHYALEKMLLV